MSKVLTPHLTILHWDVTNACNFRCTFCGNSSGCRLPDELTTNQGFRLIEEAAALGIRFIRLLGGEPFVRKDTVQLIQATVSRKIQILFSTNGSLITSDIARVLAKVRSWLLYVQVSLYGACPEDYEAICGKGEFFAMACRGIKLLSDAGIKPTVLSVIGKYNITKIAQLCTLASELGAKAFRVAPAIPQGRAVYGDCISHPEFYGILKDMLEHYRPNIPIEVTAYPLLADFLEKRLPIQVRRLRCSAALTEMYIAPNGYSRPCPFGDASEENQNPLGSEALIYPSASIEEIWHSPMFQRFRLLHDSMPKTSPHVNCPYSNPKRCRPCPLGKTSCLEMLSKIGWPLLEREQNNV